MEKVSTYELLGLPDALAVALALICLSVSIAPWFGGLELGPLKVPKVPKGSGRSAKLIAPVLFIASVSAFVPAWEFSDQPLAAKEPEELDEVELRWIEENFGSTAWSGGESWGGISFDQTGRSARYTNAPGRSPGAIVISGSGPGGSGFIIFPAVWKQDDGKSGEMEILISGYGDRIIARWGPDMSITSEWSKTPGESIEDDSWDISLASLPILIENHRAHIGDRRFTVNANDDLVEPSDTETGALSPNNTDFWDTQEFSIRWDQVAIIKTLGMVPDPADLQIEYRCQYVGGLGLGLFLGSGGANKLWYPSEAGWLPMGSTCGRQTGSPLGEEPVLSRVQMRLTGKLSKYFELSLACRDRFSKEWTQVIPESGCASSDRHGVHGIRIEVDSTGEPIPQ